MTKQLGYIWLDDDSPWSEAECGCRLEVIAHDGRQGPALYLCPLHSAAPELLRLGKAVLESLERNLAADFLGETKAALKDLIAEATDEPRNLRPIRVHWSDGDTTETNVNGTRRDVEAYYLGNRFNFSKIGWDHDTQTETEIDNYKTALRVEFLD